MSKEALEKSAELLAENVRGFEQRTLERIGNRIKRTGQLSAYDRKTIDNLANLGYSLDDIYKEIAKGGNAELYQKLRSTNIDINKLNQDVQMLNINGDIKIIQDDLDAVLEFNKKEVQKMYEAEMTEQVKRSQALYKTTGTPFIPYEGNAFAQQLVKNWAETTAGEMINLSRTKALKLGWFDETSNATNFLPINEVYQKTIDKAVVAVRTGTSDFYTEMRQVIETIGQHGAVQYESGVVRHIDNVVRQNILYGAKQSAQQYQEHIGKQFGADGFEVDYHPHPRPSHAPMGGKMFAYGGKDRTINGVTYPSGEKEYSGEKSPLDLLKEYNCLHFKTDVLLGISEPAWDSEELERRKAEDKKLIEYEVNGKTLSKTKYEWSQKQRELERMAREEKRQADFNKSCGNNIKAKEHNKSYRQIRNAYDDLCDKVGLTPTPERMAVYTSGKAKSVSSVVKKADEVKIKPLTTKDYMPAKTIEEAEKQALKFVNQNAYSPTFKGQISYKGISIENANQINKSLNTIYENIDVDKISGIKVISPTSTQGKKAFKDGADAVFAYNPVEKGIFVNKDILKNAKSFEEYVKKADDAWNVVMSNMDKLSPTQKELAMRYKNAGRSLVGNTVEDMTTHEMGHHIQWNLLTTDENNSIGKTMSEYAPKISGYANASKGEYLAESFSAYVKGEIDILDPQFVKALNKKRK